MKAAFTLVLTIGLAVSACSTSIPAADLPALSMAPDRVIPALTAAGFSCHLNDGEQPFYACRDTSMSAEPMSAFISVDIANGIELSATGDCFPDETPTVDQHPALAYPVLLAKGFEAAWVPSNDQVADASALPAVTKEAAAPMKALGKVLGLQPTTIAAACGLEIPNSAGR
jgi:hypothetical protein